MALRVTYTGGDAPQRWLFDADEVDVMEAERIEQALGPETTWDDFLLGLPSPSVRLRRVLLWHLIRRTNPDYDLRFEDAPTFKMGQLIIELGTVEIDRMLAQFEESTRLTPARKAALIATMHDQRAEAALAEAELGEVTTDPKELATPGPVPASGTPLAEGLPPEPPLNPSVPRVTSTSPSSPSS